ncbi:MAG: FAD-dependent oxidoreductase [Steroidobacteraceae bacterium]|nr:FAD-dependent oxidoreductase [Steroidobacteraceae bacterium]
MKNSTRPHALDPSPLHAPSYYAATVNARVLAPALTDERSTQVCVVGGGFTGISAALHLAQRGIEVVLLEQSRLGWGATGRNGGQAHVGLRRDQEWLERHVGESGARHLWELALEARAHLDALIETYRIECDFRPGLLHADHKRSYTAATRRHVDHLRERYGYTAMRFVGRDEVRAMVATEDYHSGAIDERGGHLHPLNYALGLARAAQSHGARLHEDSRVLEITRSGTDWQVRTATARVRAAQVILACNGYLRGIAPIVERHVMPINNFVATTEPLGEDGGRALIRDGVAVSDSRFVVNYYRITADNRLLFGGGETYGYRFPADICGFVRRHALRIFPQLAATRFEYGWGGTLGITPTRMPFVREIKPGFYNVSGFSGLGVLLAPYCGKILADALAGERAGFARFAQVPVPAFPGGPALRWPTLVAAMSWYALRDRL